MPRKKAVRRSRSKKKAYKKSSVNLKLRRKYRKASKSIKKYGIAFVLFFLSLGFLGTLSLYKYVHQNMASALSPSTHSISDDLYPAISYVVVDSFESEPVMVESVKFILIDKSSNKLVSYEVPLSISVDVPGKYGEEEFSKIFALGGLNSEDKLLGGTSLISRTLFKVFGFKPDKFVLIENKLKSDFDDYWSGGELFSLLDSDHLTSFPQSLKTDLDLKEFLEINKFLNSLPSDRFIEKFLTSSYVENENLLDEEFRDITFESKLSTEKKDIAVLNGTEYSGVASFGARVVRNFGGRIVAIGNSNELHRETILVVDSKESSTVRELSYIFDNPKVIEHSEAPQYTESEFDRADIVLILGFDFVERM
jgi:hypothetical protein